MRFGFVGGGSTEFAFGHGKGMSSAAAISIPVGCVRITEMFMQSDPPSAEQLKAAEEYVEGQLKQVIETISIEEVKTFVGVAGILDTAPS